MRRSIICAVFVLLLAGPTYAQTPGSAPNCNTGAEISVEDQGQVDVSGQCGCVPTLERPCICDVLVLESPPGGPTASRVRSCTIQTNTCTPKHNSPPSCGDSERASARAITRLAQLEGNGGSVLRLQYQPGSTYAQGVDDLIVTSSYLRSPAEANAVLGSFVVGDPYLEPGQVIPSADTTRLHQIESDTVQPHPFEGQLQVGDLGERGTIRPVAQMNQDDEMQLWEQGQPSQTFTNYEERIEDVGAAQRALYGVAERVGDGAERLLDSVRSAPVDLTSGENWGESILDRRTPSDALTWDEWERRLALQTGADRVATEEDRLEYSYRAALERSMDELRSVYPPGSPQHQAVLRTYDCLNSGECATYEAGMRHLTDNLGIYGDAADRLNARVTDVVDDPEGIVRALPDSAIYYDEAALRREEDAQMQAVIDQGERDVFAARMQTVLDEEEQLELERDEFAERIQPVLDAEAEAEAERERQRIEEWYRTPPDPDAPLPEPSEADLIERGVEARLAAEAAEAAERARLTEIIERSYDHVREGEFRQAWEAFFGDSRETPTPLVTTYPAGEGNYFLQTDPETGMMRTPGGAFRSDDPVAVEQYRQWWDNWVEAGNIEAAALADFDRRSRIEAQLSANQYISDPVPFGRDSSVIPETYRTEVLAPAAGVLSGLRGDIAYIEVTGHASQGPGSSLLYNDNLSWQRAEEVRLFLSQNPGLSGVDIRSVGAGFRNPLPGVPRNDGAQQRVVIRIVYR